MRRFASVFRRSDKSGVSPADDVDCSQPRPVRKKSRVFQSLSRKHPTHSPPPLLATDLANSPSSSSSGSTTLRTPDDDGLPRTLSKKGSWKAWLGAKTTAIGDHPEEQYSPSWQSSQRIPSPLQPRSHRANDPSERSDDPYSNPGNIHNPAYSPQQMATARTNARIMIMNSLVHDPTLPPLLQSSEVLSFPRSCHNSLLLRRRETLESQMHKKSLLARLHRLSPSAESSIAPLALKPITSKPQPNHSQEGTVFRSADSVCFHSSGLENWVSRPCFEDRFHLWTCSDSGEIIRTRIQGSQLGVAALEFSESLELLAGTLLETGEDSEVDITLDPALEFSLPPLTFNLDPSATQAKASDLEPLSPPRDLSQSENSPAKPSISPHLSISPTTGSEDYSPGRQPKDPTTSGSAAPNDPVPKRGVRFADDDGKDDQIPLGYVLRIRKNKEQKARFLREERARRTRAAQLSMENRRGAAPPPPGNRVTRVVIPRHLPSQPLISLRESPKPRQREIVSQVTREEERLRREAEMVEMEKLRRSRELAKQQAEERERTYTEELQATRARREASRAGRPLESATLTPLRVGDRARSGSRESMHVSSRGSSIPRKHVPELVFSPVSPREGSPSGSLPATPGSQYSRPPSLYSAHTASSEDVRGRDRRRASRRMSVMSDSPKGVSPHSSYDPRASFNPYAWAGIPPVPAMPTVLPTPAMQRVSGVPFYGSELPLLPPTAPFMVNQFGVRSRSYTGIAGQHSPLQSSASLSKNYSSEGINSTSRNSSPHSSGSHQRHSSDEGWMARMYGDPRAGSYNDIRSSMPSASKRVTPSQSSPQRSSWFSPEPSPTQKLSSRPASTAYLSSTTTYARRRTAAS